MKWLRQGHPFPQADALKMNSQLPQVFNEVRFDRMSCGDPSGFHELADEFFEDIRTRMAQWQAMADAGEYTRLGADFHRCKGGSAMFGFERLYQLFGAWEAESRLEIPAVNLERFSEEIAEAEKAIAGLRARTHG